MCRPGPPSRGRAPPGRSWSHVGSARRPPATNGARRPVDPDRRKRTPVARAHAPRIQQHAGQVAGVVGVEVGEPDRLQTSEVESRIHERRRRTAAAVDHEDPIIDDQRRGDPRAARDGERRARRAQEHEFGCHGDSPTSSQQISNNFQPRRHSMSGSLGKPVFPARIVLAGAQASDHPARRGRSRTCCGRSRHAGHGRAVVRALQARRR